ncbi:cytochrome C oxidase subunit IV family protein [Bradyrhizobium brasilense]|uniref:Cytochrome c oxidase subunit 4 n=1 Tax=Bradyrhizobium brasilense TaxID=1419277 RepID=A0A1G6R0V1_9BRAD|nr:cytochrome C oxidase subunit IV family protein [Bradyrhizobium brasilense]MCC8969495.1 cytochrome C oxidase subunit IV family protein [Bradyrhizobium brasilense]SDC97675.1 cytochrome c oxidase subunit 4 [Bradyrhizobium brasilense]
MTNWWPPLMLVGSWLALLALLALTVTLAYLPLGSFNSAVAIVIAAIKATIVAVFFMELRDRGARLLIFAGAGLFWLGILLWLGLMDFMTRAPA